MSSGAAVALIAVAQPDVQSVCASPFAATPEGRNDPSGIDARGGPRVQKARIFECRRSDDYRGGGQGSRHLLYLFSKQAGCAARHDRRVLLGLAWQWTRSQ